MKEAARVISLISRTSGYNEKLFLLKKNESVPYLKPILKFIYNPYLRTGIATSKLNGILDMCKNISNPSPLTCEDAIAYFDNHRTGSDSDLRFAAEFIRANEADAYELAIAMVTQNLKIGITATSLNTVYGKEFIPKIGCILGKPFADVETKIKWPCIVTEKLDGARRILIKEGKSVHMYTRSGHEDDGLVDILREAAHLPTNMVYDGELLAIGDFTDSIALRQATASISNSGGNKTGLTFNVFDMIPLDEYNTGAGKQEAIIRKILLGATFMDESIQHLDDRWPQLIAAYGIHMPLEFIKPVPILGICKNMGEVEPIVNEIWHHGKEGVMLNTVGGKYEIKRSNELIKVKHTKEYTLPVTGFIEGNGKFDGMLGALVVDYNGAQLGVGSGFTDSQRMAIWYHKKDYVGKMVEIDSFGESTNAAGGRSLNCPIFKRFVGDEE